LLRTTPERHALLRLRCLSTLSRSSGFQRGAHLRFIKRSCAPIDKIKHTKARPMSKSDTNLVGGIVLLLFLAQPLIISLYIGKTYHRNEIIWALIGLLINISLVLFFEHFLKASTLIDFVAEVVTVTVISAAFVFIVLEMLRSNLQDRNKK